MINLKRILVPTDFSSCSEAALIYATSFARLFGSEIHLLHVTDIHYYDKGMFQKWCPNLDCYQDNLKKQIEINLKQLVETHEIPEVPIVNSEKCCGDAIVPSILDYVNENNIDLIIMGTHGKRGLIHMFLGSVAEGVSRATSCPVLTVHEQGFNVIPPYRILVPIDFTSFSKDALNYIAALNNQLKGKIDVLHVMEELIPPAYYLSEWNESLNKLTDNIFKRLEESMHHFIEGTEDQNNYITARVDSGKPLKRISSYVENNNVDLICIGSHGSGGFMKNILGSITERVLRHVKCPVLTVKTNTNSLSQKWL